MKDECLICGAPLEYLENDVLMECAVCHKKENSKTACVNGHYVCNDCHTQGLDSIIAVCLRERSKNPIEIIQKMMALPFCHMHGPEHHVMVGAALLTAYKNAGGEIDLEKALSEMQARGRQVPGGTCGFWGACGACIPIKTINASGKDARFSKRMRTKTKIPPTDLKVGGIFLWRRFNRRCRMRQGRQSDDRRKRSKLPEGSQSYDDTGRCIITNIKRKSHTYMGVLFSDL